MSRRPAARSEFEHFLRFWLPAIGYTALVLAIGATPRLQPPLHFQNADKLLHVLEYGPLGLLFARALRASIPAHTPVVVAGMALALGVLVGATDETIQRFTPGRESSVLDLAADAAGVTLAQLLVLVALRQRGEA